MLYVGCFSFLFSFISADSCGFCEEGKHSEFRRPFPLLALLPSGHGRTGCCPSGKAPAADRLPQATASDALSPEANSSSVCLRRLTFHTPHLPGLPPRNSSVRQPVFINKSYTRHNQACPTEGVLRGSVRASQLRARSP